jgi:hypothetical protein
MAVDAVTVKRLLEAELAKLSDTRVDRYIRSLVIEPTSAPRGWDYGDPGQKYVCWTVLEHHYSNSSIVYCEDGFGPSDPWGLLFLTGEHTSMGMDSQWYPTFLQTFFESQAATYLPIWRVFKTDASGAREAISDESTWDETWSAVMTCRKADPAASYDCDTSISYERE